MRWDRIFSRIDSRRRPGAAGVWVKLTMGLAVLSAWGQRGVNAGDGNSVNYLNDFIFGLCVSLVRYKAGRIV